MPRQYLGTWMIWSGLAGVLAGGLTIDVALLWLLLAEKSKGPTTAVWLGVCVGLLGALLLAVGSRCRK